MKITKEYLRTIIKEEISNIAEEMPPLPPPPKKQPGTFSPQALPQAKRFKLIWTTNVKKNPPPPELEETVKDFTRVCDLIIKSIQTGDSKQMRFLGQYFTKIMRDSKIESYAPFQALMKEYGGVNGIIAKLS
jgi:hypothetical protein